MWTRDEEQRLRELRIDPARLTPERLVKLVRHFEDGRGLYSVYKKGDPAKASQELARKIKILTLDGKLKWVLDEDAILQQSEERLVKHDAQKAEGISLSLAQFPVFEHWYPRNDFVGRSAEWDAVKDNVQGTAVGRGRILVLGGEPGIGKTRLAMEAAQYAAQNGFNVLWGTCNENRLMNPPYWPWVQALRFPGGKADHIAASLAEMESRQPDIGPPPLLGSVDGSQVRIFEYVTDFLRVIASKVPVLLVLEDLHWADENSLALLQTLNREIGSIRIMVLATYRDTEVPDRHPLVETLADLSQTAEYRRMILHPWSERDVDEFVRSSAAGLATISDVESIHSRSGGNPLYVEFILADTDSTVGLAAPNPRRPENVRDVIGRRVDRLSVPCKDMLAFACVMRDGFQFDQISTLMEGSSKTDLIDILDEAINARVLGVQVDSVDRYSFSHGIIKEVLARNLNELRKAWLHERVASVLEEVYGGDAVEHADELAYHYGEAGFAGTSKAVRYSLAAGEQALAAYAYSEAIRYFERVITLKGNQDIDGEIAAALFGLGRAKAETSYWNQAEEVFVGLTQAFDYYVRTGETHRAIALAEFPFYHVPDHRIGVSSLIQRALQLVAPGSEDEGRLLACHSVVIGIGEADYDNARQAIDKALMIAHQLSDRSLERKILYSASIVDIWHLKWQECLEMSQRLLGIGGEVDEFTVAANLCSFDALMAGGDGIRARHSIEVAIAQAEKLRDPARLALCLWGGERFALVQGQWNEARELSDQVIQLWPQDPRPLGSRILIEFQQGDYARGEYFIKQLLDIESDSESALGLRDAIVAGVLAIVAHNVSSGKYLDHSKVSIDRLFAMTEVTPALAVAGRIGIGLIAIAEGDSATASDAYNGLRSYRGAMLGLGIISSDRLLGLLCGTAGDTDTAIQNFEAAVRFCRDAGYLSDYAWSAYDCAEAMIKRGRRRDTQQARKMLQDSMEQAGILGMKPLLERCELLTESMDDPFLGSDCP